MAPEEDGPALSGDGPFGPLGELVPDGPRRRRRPVLGIVVAVGAAIAVGVPLMIFVRETVPLDELRADAPEVSLPDDVLARIATLPDHRNAIPAISYHDVSDRAGSYTVTPRRFAEHMAALSAGGFQPVGLDMVEALTSGTRPVLPRRPVLITFDDGLASNWTHADPILARHRFRATAFLATSAVVEKGPSYYLSWSQLAKLGATGRWTFGAHTHRGHRTVPVSAEETGPWLTNLERTRERQETIEQWRQRVVDDLARNKAMIFQRLGVEARALAYPFSSGRHPVNDERIPDELDRIVSNEFPIAFGIGTPQAITARSPRWSLPRLTVTSDLTAAGLVDAIERMTPDPFPVRLADLAWKAQGGSCVPLPGGVAVSTDRYVSCTPDANTISWLDYRLSLRVRGASRDATALVGLRQGRHGRAEVALGEGSVVVRQHVGGAWAEVARQEGLSVSTETSLDIAVVGDQLSVTVPPQEPLTVSLDPAVRSGGIAFGLAARGPASVEFRQERLEELG